VVRWVSGLVRAMEHDLPAGIAGYVTIFIVFPAESGCCAPDVQGE
jgi:hypothetical protein